MPTRTIGWLDARTIAYDVICVDDLDQHGLAPRAPYRCVMTGTHPEYPSKRMIDAFAAFQKQEGRFIDMGGNGFWWGTAYVATADNFSAGYHWMTEEQTHTHAAVTGETCPHVHCDMVFYETPHGGAVFSTSSIAWAGALSHTDYENNVSRITENVIRRFVNPEKFDLAD